MVKDVYKINDAQWEHKSSFHVVLKFHLGRSFYLLIHSYKSVKKETCWGKGVKSFEWTPIWWHRFQFQETNMFLQ